MPVLIGLLVAAAFGTGDFLGGLASRRAATVVVLATAQVVALTGAVVVALVFGGEATSHDLVLGAFAGLLNVAALGCLFHGLAIGQIGQVAPLTAVVAAVIPIGWGLATGERPSPTALVGAVLAVAAGALVSREKEEPGTPASGRALVLAVAAGIGFGSSFVCFAAASHGTGFWPVLSARAAAVVGVGAALAVTRPRLTLDRVPGRQAIGAGLFDITATTLLLVAVRIGLAATVAPVAALAPGFTVAHAWWYLHERASRIQVVGLVLALVGLALIAMG